MEPAEIFEAVLAPGERLLWSGAARADSGDLGVLGAVMFLAVPVVPILAMLIVGPLKPLPVNGRIGYFATLAVGLANLAFAVHRNRTQKCEHTKIAYGVTDRRLLCAAGHDRKGIREAPLKNLEVPEVVAAGRYGAQQLLHFKLRKRAGASSPSMWSFVESGKPDTWCSHQWRVENWKNVASIAARAICAAS